MKGRRILVGVDGSVGWDRALRWSIELARELDAEIVAVHVLELPRHPINLVRFIEVGEVSDKALGDELQPDWCAPLHDAGVKYRTILAEGPPAPALLSLADAEDASMVVVGLAWARRFHRAAARERDHAVAHHARRPVVIVPPGIRAMGSMKVLVATEGSEPVGSNT